MRMYVWSVQPKWIAVAHANSVAEARQLLMSSDNIGESGDGSCSIRDSARKYVTDTEPTQWMGPNAEFALTDSSELREQEEYNQVLYSIGVELATALKELMPDGWGEDDTMDHMPGIRLARMALQRADGKLGHWRPSVPGVHSPSVADESDRTRTSLSEDGEQPDDPEVNSRFTRVVK